MKHHGMIKLILFFIFLLVTDFFGSASVVFLETTDILEHFIDPSWDWDENDLRRQMMLFHTYQTQAEEKKIPTTTDVNPVEVAPKQKPRIYLYNTHQTERYADGKTTVDASLRLAEYLQMLDCDVVVELNDFTKYAKQNGYSYDELYEVSRKYMEDAIAKYGGFDVMIDVHRDAAPHNSAVTEVGGTVYAKMMFVVSLNTDYGTQQYNTAKQMVTALNGRISGIAKNPFKKYYTTFNQELHQQVYLIEVGSNHTSWEEVDASLQILALELAERVKS